MNEFEHGLVMLDGAVADRHMCLLGVNADFTLVEMVSVLDRHSTADGCLKMLFTDVTEMTMKEFKVDRR